MVSPWGFSRCTHVLWTTVTILGLSVVADTANTFYCVGGRTGFGIHAPTGKNVGRRFRQGSVGLHRRCFRARERADVDEAYNFLLKIGNNIVNAPREDSFAPGHYSVLFRGSS